MLTQLDLRHFKCFELLHLPLRPLTLLAGANASGKYSVLQALVLLHQTMREHEWSLRLRLNGGDVQLGTVYDVVDQVHGRRTCEIGLVDEETSYKWTFAGERSEMSMGVESVVIGDDILNNPAQLHYLLPPATTPLLAEHLRDLAYLTAERIGPREMYKMDDLQVSVGPSGEHAVSVLYSKRDEYVCKALALPDVPDTCLRQVEARMRTFFPGCRLEVAPIPHANTVRLGLRTADDMDFHRPIHAGFGLTQVLPVVVAALSASDNDLLLIENPEVHLHPAGQAQMGQFLAEVAQSGVQVILETHSDHVLNGIRRVVKEGRLSAEQVAIHFFRPRSEDGDALRAYPFAHGAAQHILRCLDKLDQLKVCFDADGKRTAEGHRLYQRHFTGDRAWFSDSSDTEKAEFKTQLTFRHPATEGQPLFCPWHGKVNHHPPLRIHFSWPITAADPLYVVYVGPKLTRR